MLTQRDQSELADEVIRHVLYAAPFRSGEVQDTLRFAIISRSRTQLPKNHYQLDDLLLSACALKQRRYDLILDQCRKLMIVRQFNNDPYRLFLAVCASGLPQTDLFIQGTLQKHIVRELRITEAAKKGTAIWYSKRRRYMISTDKSVEANEDPDREGVADEDIDYVPSNEKAGVFPRPTRKNAALYTMYGQSCATARSFQSSLCELARSNRGR